MKPRHWPGQIIRITNYKKRHASNNEHYKEQKKAKFGSQQGQKNEKSNEPRKCKICKEQQTVHRCAKFIKMDINERRKTAKEQNLCYNCLSPSHSSRNCRASNCKRCDKKHNSLLCIDNPRNKSTNTAQVKRQQKSQVKQSDAISNKL